MPCHDGAVLTDLLVPITVVVGEEELLVSRAIDAVLAAARAEDAGCDVRDLVGADLTLPDLLDLLGPTLFADRRVVIIRAAQDLSRDVVAALTSYASDPAEGVCLVVHLAGAKGRRFDDALTALGTRRVGCVGPKWPEERQRFVREELSAVGGSATDGAVEAILESVGTDLRSLATACAQLADDTCGTIDAAVVRRYYRGRAEATGFAVADRAVEGDLPGALEELRWALSTGAAPVLVVGALAGSLRVLARVAEAGRDRPESLATRLGVPPWRVKRARSQLRGWEANGLTCAIIAVAVADAQVKGAGADPAYALERAVLAVVAARAGQ